MAHLAHYKEAHPMPMRVTHWINLICMACLIFSGFLIHFPFWAALTGVARGAHVFLGIVLLVNCIVRIVFAFLLQTAPTGGTRNLVRDYKTWLPQASARCLDQVLPVHQEGSSFERKARRSSKDFLLGSCFLDSHYGLHRFLPLGSYRILDLLRSGHLFGGRHDVYAHHSLLHDVCVHHLQHVAHLSCIHRRYCSC